MYAYIKGTLAEVGNQQVILEAHGIGYLIYVPNTVITDLPRQGEAAKLYTYMHLREDAQELYGFIDEEDKLFFDKLISVSGIGPKVALNMLSSYSRAQLAMAILTGDSRLLSTVPGVGKKTADRIILELKDKLDKAALAEKAGEGLPTARGSIYFEALEALQGLGYSAADAEDALRGLEGKDASDLIRQALRSLDNRNR